MRSVSPVGARILQVLAAFFIAVISSHAASVTLAWDPNTESDIAGYHVLYGTSSGTYSQVLDAGNTPSAVVPNLAEGVTYYFAVKAYNHAAIDSPVSAEISFTPPLANTSPAVAFTAPTNGSTYVAPASITLNATASDNDGSIARVEFYQGTTKLGEDTTSPYSFTWNGVASGTYTLTARAVDNRGAETASSPANVTVSVPNQPPTVAITSPTGGSIHTAPATITINSAATDPDGSVARVDFYAGTNKIGSSTTSPYNYIWSNVASGTYSLTSVAVDGSGLSTTSAQVSIIVNASPTVAIQTNGTSFTAPASITITATPADTDGTISRVEFFNGATKLGESTASPFVFTWSNAPAGNHSLSARAYDNRGASGNSAPVNVAVASANQPPAVAITSPSIGSTFTAPASVTIAASASDSDGTIARVDFFQGTTKLGQDTTSPYSISWSNVAAGNYTLTAVAVDNSGNTKTSNPVSVSVQSRNVVLTTNGTNFAPGATISLSASTAQLSGRIRRVDFYRDSVLLYRDSKYAYAYAWKNVPAGTYVLTAKAFMGSGAIFTSAPVTVTVGAIQPAAMMAVTSSYEDPIPTVTPYRQHDGTFNLGITGQTGQTYKVWVSTDLANWSLMTTVTNDIGFISITDPDAPNHKQRFYRVSVQE